MDGERFVRFGRWWPAGASSALIVVSEHAREQLPGAVAALLGRTRGPLLEPQPQRRHAAFARRLRQQQLGLRRRQRAILERTLGPLAVAACIIVTGTPTLRA